jgi:multidrug efflux pump subunit AcrB
MRLPEGTAIGVTDATAKKAERLLTGDPDIATYTSYVGQGSPRFWLGLNPVLPNPNFAQIVIVTKDLPGRERVKTRLDRALADGALPEARTRVDRFNFGPPVGFPVQFRVVGPDPMKVRTIADEVRTVMAANRKIVDPHLNWGEQVKSIRRKWRKICRPCCLASPSPNIARASNISTWSPARSRPNVLTSIDCQR